MIEYLLVNNDIILISVGGVGVLGVEFSNCFIVYWGVRVDYVLLFWFGFDVNDVGVFWFVKISDLYWLVKDCEVSLDYRLVWISLLLIDDN